MRADDKSALDWPHFDPKTVEAAIVTVCGSFTPGMQISKRTYVRVMQECTRRYTAEKRPLISAQTHSRIELLAQRQADRRGQANLKTYLEFVALEQNQQKRDL